LHSFAWNIVWMWFPPEGLELLPCAAVLLPRRVAEASATTEEVAVAESRSSSTTSML
jgi:hypothetical protein